MADITLTAKPALAGTGIRFGPNLVMAPAAALALISVAIPRGGEAALARALEASLRLAMPASGMSTTSGDRRAIWLAQDQLMLVFPDTSGTAEHDVQDALNGTGYTTEQTDVWATIVVEGPGTRTALERLCPLDLHDDAFPVGAAARTVMEHMGTIIVRTGQETYLLMSASSSAKTFLGAVQTSFEWTASV